MANPKHQPARTLGRHRQDSMVHPQVALPYVLAVSKASSVITTGSNSHNRRYVMSEAGKAAKCNSTQVALSVTIQASKPKARMCATELADGEANRPLSLSLASPTNTLM